MTTLNETLTLISAQIKCDAAELIAYSNEDTLGGYHVDPEQSRFKQGGLWEVEGKILYALIRWLQPETVVEIGGWEGASSAHMALAVKANGHGRVISVDNEVGGMAHGSALPSELSKYVTLVSANGEDWLPTQEDGSIGFLFEDADHSRELVEKLVRLGLRKVMPGGLIVNHDALHDWFHDGNSIIPLRNDPAHISQNVDMNYTGTKVRDGLQAAGAYFRVYKAEPSDCGLAITVMPGVKENYYEGKLNTLTPKEVIVLRQNEWTQPEQIGNANIESASEPPELKDIAEVRNSNWPYEQSPKTAAKKPATKRGKGSRKPSAK